jgi:signal transduction histidine kinase
MRTLFLFLLFQTFTFANSSILIINSYHKGYEWSDSILQGIEESLFKIKEIETNVLYMDSKRVSSKEYYDTLKNLYKIQLKNQKYDLIIAIDRFAYDFVLDSYDDLFTDEQILAVGIESFSKEKAKKHGLENKISAILEKRDLETNIKIIEKLYPSLKKLFIINDKSQNALHTEPQILEVLQKNHNTYQMIYLQENNLANLADKFSKIEKDTVILFIRFYKSQEGKLYKNYEIENFIQNAKVPVFITDSIFIKKGALGGKIIDLHKLGFSSGEMALDILKFSQPTIVVFDDYDVIFDAKKLEEFFLSIVEINDTYTLVNEKETIYKKYRSFINFVFTISPLFLLLIVGLILTIYKRKKIEKDRQFAIQQSKLAEVGEVFSSIAHQWKSPLVEITTIAQELFYTQKDTKMNMKENDSFVSDIMKQVNYMTDTINNFQKFIMPSNAKSKFYVDDAIKSMLDIIDHHIKYNNIKISLDLPSDILYEVYGYKNEFMQSFLNIINNAKEQLLQNDTKNRNIHIRVFNQNDNLILEIEDNAGGIYEKDIYKIFKPYYTTKVQGHGIGLYMTKVIIEDKMGGKIWVKNINEGVTFTIQLDQNI